MAKTTLKNSTNLGMTLSLWLAMDGYDHDPENAPRDSLPIISVTQLLKPTKALVLGNRVPEQDREVEIVDLAAARIGQSIHTAIENAFEHPDRNKILTSMGASESIMNRIVVNPSAAEIDSNPDMIPVFLEHRAFRKIVSSAGTEVWISGKFDQVVAGKPEDNKTTSTYKYTKMDQTEKGEYALQMAMYKWLNPQLITSDVGQINFIFKDWKRSEVGRINNYPPHAVMEMPVNLMSEQDAENFIRNKIDEIEKNAAHKSEADMTRCTDDELWRSPDKHKYYKNPETAKKGGRSTKNFDTYAAAMAHKMNTGVGVVVTIPGEVRRCSYCDAAPLCTQRLEY